MTRRGMTLVEVMIAATIFSVLLAGVFNVMMLSTAGVKQGDLEAMLTQELEVAVATVRADLRAARVDLDGGRTVGVSGAGKELLFARSYPGAPGRRPGLMRVHYKFEPGAEASKLVRTVESLPGEPAGAAEATETVSTRLSAVRFTVYTRRMESPLVEYATRIHAEYAPIFVRIELAAATGAMRRDLVTSVALQPFSRTQLDPFWNPVPPP